MEESRDCEPGYLQKSIVCEPYNLRIRRREKL